MAVKRYYFDSRTKLLAKVGYRQTKARGATTVESEFSDWATTNGQPVPRTFVRREDGVEMLRLRISQVVVTGAVADGIFGGGPGK